MRTGPFGALSTITEFQSDILVNGNLQKSFDQGSNAGYDVSISTSASHSPTPARFMDSSWGSFSIPSDGTWHAYNTGSNGQTHAMDYYFYVDGGSYAGGSIEVVDCTGSVIDSVSHTEGENHTLSGTASNGVRHLRIKEDSTNGNYNGVDAWIEINVTSSSSYTVNGVTQS